jgi:hypothetical protein
MHAGYISSQIHVHSFASPLQQWLYESPSMLRYTNIACHLRLKHSRNHNFILLIWSWKCVTCVLECYYFSRASWSWKKTSDINKQATQPISTADTNPHLPSLSGKENRKPRSDSVSWPTANIQTDINISCVQTRSLLLFSKPIYSTPFLSSNVIPLNMSFLLFLTNDAVD